MLDIVLVPVVTMAILWAAAAICDRFFPNWFGLPPGIVEVDPLPPYRPASRTGDDPAH